MWDGFLNLFTATGAFCWLCFGCFMAGVCLHSIRAKIRRRRIGRRVREQIEAVKPRGGFWQGSPFEATLGPDPPEDIP